MHGGAVVISGVDPAFHKPIFMFASDLCHTSEIDLICQPGLGSLLHRGVLTSDESMKRQVLREIFEARANTSWQRGFQTCVIVAPIPCNRGHEHFETCIELVQRERDELRRMTRFRKFHLACHTPNLRIEYVGVVE